MQYCLSSETYSTCHACQGQRRRTGLQPWRVRSIRLISSLLGQTMSSAEYEVVFVDDGSTDETPEKLDRSGRRTRPRQGAAHPELRLARKASQPRDRQLRPANTSSSSTTTTSLRLHALERLHAYATENDSERRRRQGGTPDAWAGECSARPSTRTDTRATLRSAPLLTGA